MPSARANVPTPKPNLLRFQEALEGLLWTMPTADFSVYIDPEGAGATVSDSDGVEHMADVRHPELVAYAVRRAMVSAFNVQPDGGWVRDERIDAYGLGRAFFQALTWLPEYILTVGREGNEVWATVEGSADAGAHIRLDSRRYSLSDALIAAAALAKYDDNYDSRDPLTFSVPEAREAA